MSNETDRRGSAPVDSSKDNTALTRAATYLNYKPIAKWTAYVCAVGVGALFVLLLLLLGLFTDLMVHRGLLPSYRELSFDGKRQVWENWDGLNEKQRLDLLNEYDNRADAKQANENLAKSKFILTEQEAALEEKKQPRLLTNDEYNQVWRAMMYSRIRERVSAEAAEVIKPYGNNEKGELVAKSTFDRPHGMLSLIARSDLQREFHTPLLGWFASWNEWTWKGATNTPLSPYIVGLLLITLLLVILRGAMTVLMYEMASQTTIEAASRLRRAVYHHTFRLGTLAFRAVGPSEAVTVFTRHVEATHDALQARLTVMTKEPFKFIVLVLFAFVVGGWVAFAFVLFALLVWVVGGQIAAYFKRQERMANNEASEQLTLIRESLMMMRLVKCYAIELFNQSRVERQLTGLAQTQQQRARGEAIYRPSLFLMGTLAAVILLAVAGTFVLKGNYGVASIVMMTTALFSLYWPMRGILEHRKIMRRGRDSAVQLFRFLDRPGDVGQVVGAEFLPDPAKQVEFDNVSLRESGSGRTLLKDVSLSIRVGQRIGLIGADDQEKHAFVYLIPRLLDPTSGEIRIDDHSLRWVTIDSLRDKIGTVLMHNLVFHDTVANNIGCGDTAYPLPKIIEAAKQARAHQFISKLPQGYDTPIGELNKSLPVHQQYRIALARAILRDPSIVILEEPEEAFPENVKDLIDDVFARFLPGRTVIFLPHRISTIRSCDRLYLLHKGRIEAAGVHKELLSSSKLYRHLHYLEFNEVAELV